MGNDGTWMCFVTACLAAYGRRSFLHAAQPFRMRRALDGVDALLAVRMRTTSSTALTKTLPVADLSGTRRLADEIDDLLRALIVHYELETHFGNHVEQDLSATVVLAPAVLVTATHDLRNRHARDVRVEEGLLERLELLGSHRLR